MYVKNEILWFNGSRRGVTLIASVLPSATVIKIKIHRQFKKIAMIIHNALISQFTHHYHFDGGIDTNFVQL